MNRKGIAIPIPLFFTFSAALLVWRSGRGPQSPHLAEAPPPASIPTPRPQRGFPLRKVG